MIPAYIQQWIYTQLEQLRYTNVRQCFIDVCSTLNEASWLKPRAATLQPSGGHLITLQGTSDLHRVEIWLSTGYPHDASYVFVDSQPRAIQSGLTLHDMLRVALEPPPKPEKPIKPPPVPLKPPKSPTETSANTRHRPPKSPPAPPPKGPIAPSSSNSFLGSKVQVPVQTSHASSVPPLPAKVSEYSSRDPQFPALSPGPLPPPATQDYVPFQPNDNSIEQANSPYTPDPKPLALHRPEVPVASVPSTPTIPSASAAPAISAASAATQIPSSQPVKTAIPVNMPAIDLLDITVTPNAAVSGERQQTLARLESSLHTEATRLYHQSQVDAQQLAASSQTLMHINMALAREKNSHLRIKEVLLRNIDILEQSIQSAEELAHRATHIPQVESLCDLVKVIPSERAVVEADSGSRAIDDLLRVLPKALDAGSISLHIYLRLVRQYAREQFLQRHALLQRRPQPPRPPAKQ